MRRGKPLDEAALPPAICRAVVRIQADFRSASDVGWEWAFENDPDPVEPAVLCMFGSEPGVYGVWVRCDSDEEDAAVYLADEWSEQVFETLAQENLQLVRRWPPCPRPGHDHALDPVLQGDRAVWVCQGDRTVVAIIGQLGTG